MKVYKILFDPDERSCISCNAYRVVNVSGEYGVKGSCLKAEHNDITYFGDDVCSRWERSPAGVINHEQ